VISWDPDFTGGNGGIVQTGLRDPQVANVGEMACGCRKLDLSARPQDGWTSGSAHADRQVPSKAPLVSAFKIGGDRRWISGPPLN
jgi:hypothetical protein